MCTTCASCTATPSHLALLFSSLHTRQQHKKARADRGFRVTLLPSDPPAQAVRVHRSTPTQAKEQRAQSHATWADRIRQHCCNQEDNPLSGRSFSRDVSHHCLPRTARFALLEASPLGIKLARSTHTAPGRSCGTTTSLRLCSDLTNDYTLLTAGSPSS